MNDENIQHLVCQLLYNPVPKELLHEQIKQLSSTEWESLKNFAVYHNLEPILYLRMQNLTEKTNIPEDIQEHFCLIYLKTIGNNLRIMKYTSHVLQVLKDNNLDVIGLKGIYLLDNVYQNVGSTGLGDVDLLVKEQDLAAVTACLMGLGYENKTWYDPHDDNRDLMHVPPMENQDGLMIEVHWWISFEKDPVGFDIAGLWARAVPARVADETAMSLSTEDLILHLCFHTSYHHVLSIEFQGLYDIREVIQQRQDEINWKALIQRAEAA